MSSLDEIRKVRIEKKEKIEKNKINPYPSKVDFDLTLKEVTEAAGESHYASAVGEVNVVTEMKRVNAVIGGEGNGGVIVPDLHYGRDALIGSALILSFLRKRDAH